MLDHELVALQLLVLPSQPKSPFLGRAGGPRKSRAAPLALLMNHSGFSEPFPQSSLHVFSVPSDFNNVGCYFFFFFPSL